jgi:hypothetical protein
MSKEEIDLKIAQGISDINEGRVISIDDFEKEFEKRNGI